MIRKLFLFILVSFLIPIGSLSAETTEIPEYQRIGLLDHRHYNGRIIFKFTKNTPVSLNDKQFRIEHKNLSRFNSLFQNHKPQRLFRSKTPQEYDNERLIIEKRTGKSYEDLNLYFECLVRKNKKAWNLAKKISSFSFIEEAYMEPRPVIPAHPTTPNYQNTQGYLNSAANNGIDALFAWTINGGMGDNVSIIDIENGWNLNHEDLPGNINLLSGMMTNNQASINHGTAVLGVLSGINDGFGITGIVPNSNVNVVSWSNQATATAINNAANRLLAGDIIILEGQIVGPNGAGDCNDDDSDGCVPIEWLNANRTAIQNATANGIIVIEAAGNGGNNLDDNIYNNIFNRNQNNSGAIMVGAGNSVTQVALGFSNHGSRLDLQGWGHNVMTTGYGFFSDLGNNREYTNTFNGTSSASPIVAGAFAALQGIHFDILGIAATPNYLLNILRSTGTPQGDGNRIGPLPDLNAAIVTMLDDIGNPQDDRDNDGLSDFYELRNGLDHNNPDSDGDNLNDGDEVFIHHTDPLNADSDSDGLSDGREVIELRSNPRSRDTDQDRIDDGNEVRIGSNILIRDNPFFGIIYYYLSDDENIDQDQDGITDNQDNCPQRANADQRDDDNDGRGNSCDDDIDGDGVDNNDDNCIYEHNPEQADHDNDGFGNECDCSFRAFLPNQFFLIRAYQNFSKDLPQEIYNSYEKHTEQLTPLLLKSTKLRKQFLQIVNEGYHYLKNRDQIVSDVLITQMIQFFEELKNNGFNKEDLSVAEEKLRALYGKSINEFLKLNSDSNLKIERL